MVGVNVKFVRSGQRFPTRSTEQQKIVFQKTTHIQGHCQQPNVENGGFDQGHCWTTTNAFTGVRWGGQLVGSSCVAAERGVVVKGQNTNPSTIVDQERKFILRVPSWPTEVQSAMAEYCVTTGDAAADVHT